MSRLLPFRVLGSAWGYWRSMITTLITVVMGLAPAVLAAPGGTATTNQMAGGVAELQRATMNQDYGAASNALGGLFDNGAGGFSQGSDGAVVDARQSEGTGYDGAYLTAEPDHHAAVVPAPNIASEDAETERGLLEAASLLAAGWFGLGAALAYRKAANEGGSTQKADSKKPAEEPKGKGKENTQSTVDIGTSTLKGDLPQGTADYNPRLPLK